MISSDIPLSDTFRPIAHEQKHLMDPKSRSLELSEPIRTLEALYSELKIFEMSYPFQPPVPSI